MVENVEQIKGWTVLVVDDEPDNLGVPRKVLTFYGAAVHTAENGMEGLRALAKMTGGEPAGLPTPTFILLDLSMPVMDGWAMLREIRANPRTKDLPVIALTAHAMEADRERALAAGFDGYITKPFRLDTLLRDIMACLAQMANGRSAA